MAQQELKEQMFCFQCEQTAAGVSCHGKQGVCGKTADVANLQDDLTGALIGLARSIEKSGRKADKKEAHILMRGLFTCVTNVSFDEKSIRQLIDELHEMAGTTELDYAPSQIWHDNEDIRSLKSLIIYGLRGMAAYAEHAYSLNYENQEIIDNIVESLVKITTESTVEGLLPVALKVGEVNYKTMELLDKANNESFGQPAPKEVTMKIEKGPFIIVTGHDLKDLKQLLEQTEGKGINIYTHGEMLPAHGYPELNKYPHLKGNFGVAWHAQQKEFDGVPAPILYTSNCLMVPRDSYKDRIFTTGAVRYPDTEYIPDADVKDFSKLIAKSLELGGYAEDQVREGMNGGTKVTTGFGHKTVLSLADKVVAAVKSGKIKHFFVVGGCDGARKERQYYTDIVKKIPQESVILTLGCGKYRFNDLDLGEIDGIPRLLDIGQCNDTYGALQIALALANVFDCGVNELPLSLVICWYEQKAACILLTLLYLNIQNIKLGPTLAAFLSPNIINFLVDKYKIAPITTAEEDLAQLLA